MLPIHDKGQCYIIVTFELRAMRNLKLPTQTMRNFLLLSAFFTTLSFSTLAQSSVTGTIRFTIDEVHVQEPRLNFLAQENMRCFPILKENIHLTIFL